MVALKLVNIGNSVGVVIPKDVLGKLGVGKGDTLYAFVMGWPEKLTLIRPLATSSPLLPPKISHVEMLGYQGKLTWTQDGQGLTVVMPEHKPCDYAITLKIV